MVILSPFFIFNTWLDKGCCYSKIFIRSKGTKSNIFKIMNITIKQKKLIFIILSSALVIFIFVFGINTYYKGNKLPTNPISDQPISDEIMEEAELEFELCSSDNLENQYRICCIIEDDIKESLWYDCTAQEFFEPGQNIYIVLDSSRFDISYDPYFLRINSDLNYEENKPILYESPVALDRKETSLIKILGIVPQEVKLFTLLKLSVYPDDAFDEKDEQIILNREAKIFKE